MGALGVSERIIGISIISYGKNSLDLQPTWVTTNPQERIQFVSQGPTVYIFFSKMSQPATQWSPMFFRRVRRPECQVNHPPPSSAEIRMGGALGLLPPTCRYGIGREKFAVLFVGFDWLWNRQIVWRRY
jgi:hypothetical protein